MQGKAPVIASQPVAYALDMMSKTALMDIIVQQATDELSTPARAVTDEMIVALLQARVTKVLAARKDRAINLTAAIVDFQAISDRYRDAHPQA